MKKALYLFLIVVSILPVSGQPVNDYCEGAIGLSRTIRRPGSCIDTTERWGSASAILINALPQANLPGCVLGDVPSVWFEIIPDTISYILYLKLKGNTHARPAIQLFAGTCDALEPVSTCNTGYNGQVFISGMPAEANVRYFILCGDAEQRSDTLLLQFAKWTDAIACRNEHSLEPVYRSGGFPAEGPYFPGDTVGFNYKLTWQVTTGQQNCQWFQGVVPVFGNGWDIASFDVKGQPLKATLNGGSYPAPGLHNQSTWQWFDDVRYHHFHCERHVGDLDDNGTLDLCSTILDPDCKGLEITGGCCGPCWDLGNEGTLLPGGWFAAGVDGSCGGEVGWPAVDWGDGNTCNGIIGPWNFYFEVIVSDNACFYSDPGAFSVSMFSFSDGETGSWTGGPSLCGLDLPIRYDAQVICCDQQEEVVYLTGRLFADFQSDCTYDGDEPGIAGYIVRIRAMTTDSTILVLTDHFGEFFANVDTGYYWITPLLDTMSAETCPDSALIHVTSPCDIFEVQLPVDNELFCFDDLTINLLSTPLGPCRNSQMVIEITNTGSTVFTATDILLELDSLLELQYVSVAYDDLDNDSFLIHAGNIDVGQQKRVILRVKTSCESPNGYEHCSVASLTQELCSMKKVTSTRCMVNAAAVDPNFKVDGDDFSLDFTLITDDSPIEYQIHFQNTGTSPAERITILDTLPELLDVSTLHVMGSSHPVEVSLLENHVLQFFFDQINLPDSSTDQLASRGFVVFTIAPVYGLVEGQTIDNNASIYFDFNKPVLTNLKRHIVECPDENNIVTEITHIVCPTDSFTFQGIAFDQFNPSGEIRIFDVLPNGCDSVYHIQLIFYPTIFFDSVKIVLDDGMGTGAVYLYPNEIQYSFLWSNGSDSSSIVNVTAGTYVVTITDQYGCVEVFTYEVPINTSLQRGDDRFDILIYPNPVKDLLIINSHRIISEMRIDIYNMAGEQIQRTQGQSPDGINALDVGMLPPAMYLCKVSTPTEVVILKFIKL